MYAPRPDRLPVRSSTISPSGVLRTLMSVDFGKCSPQPVHLLVGIFFCFFCSKILRLDVYLTACKTGNKLCVLSFLTYGEGELVGCDLNSANALLFKINVKHLGR